MPPPTSQRQNAHRPHDDELHGVPDRHKDDQVQPARASIGNGTRTQYRYRKVRDSDKHGWDAPLEAAPGPDEVQQDVGWKVVAGEVPSSDTHRPENAKHDRPLVTRSTPSRRQLV